MSQTFISVADAAQRLGVHQATLRRWAGRGEIPVTFTAGGHRRFAVEDLVRFIDAQRQRNGRDALGEWSEAAVARTRSELAEHPHESWLDALSEEARQRSREMGHRLMGLLLRYVSAPGSPASMEDEVRALGLVYGQQSREAGLPLTLAMQATVFFRDALFDSALHAADESAFATNNVTRLLRRLNRFVNLVQLAIAETYNAPETSALSGPQL